MRDRAKIYTEKLLYEQELRQAEIAWSAKEYKKFIKVMNGIAIEKWSDIYKLKYKIALKKPHIKLKLSPQDIAFGMASGSIRHEGLNIHRLHKDCPERAEENHLTSFP